MNKQAQRCWFAGWGRTGSGRLDVPQSQSLDSTSRAVSDMSDSFPKKGRAVGPVTPWKGDLGYAGCSDQNSGSSARPVKELALIPECGTSWRWGETQAQGERHLRSWMDGNDSKSSPSVVKPEPAMRFSELLKLSEQDTTTTHRMPGNAWSSFNGPFQVY